MNLIKNSLLIEQLAASYALGTLRGGASRRFEALARDNAVMRAAALIWQSRIASVAELQPQSVPSPAVWKRIENLVAAEKQAALQAQRNLHASAAGAPSAPGGWWASLGLWRGAAAASAMAAVVATVTGLSMTARLDGQVQQLSAQLAATPQIQYVAVLADDKASASMLVTFDPKLNQLVVKRVGGFQEQSDKSLQLWALPQSGGPKSLGVLGKDAVLRLSTSGQEVKEVPALAISLEPRGGAPAGGGPSGPVLFKGSLIETVL